MIKLKQNEQKPTKTNKNQQKPANTKTKIIKKRPNTATPLKKQEP